MKKLVFLNPKFFRSSGYGAPPAGGGGRGCTIAIENLPMSATTPRLRKSVFT